jgi:dTDP-4-dehydrorhamnose reductase
MIKVDTKKAIMVFGANGALGRELCAQASKIGLSLIKVGRADLDLGLNAKSIEEFVNDHSPGLLVNCACLTGLEKCNLQREEAIEVNGHFPRKLFLGSQINRIPLIHFSTDSVFSCNEDGPLNTEASAPRPITWYGITKYLGESFVGGSDNCLTIRMPMLYGPTNQHQIVGKLFQKIKSGEDIQVSNDVFNTLTYTPDIVRWLLDLVLGKKVLSNNLIHLTSDKRLSIYEFMVHIARLFGLEDKVKPTTSDAFKSSEQKPRFGGLKSNCVKEFSFQNAMDDYINWLSEQDKGQKVCL